MPDPIRLSITFDYAGGIVPWTAPDRTVVPHGEIDVIQWNLTCLNLPAGMTGRFAANDGIRFLPRKDGAIGDVWTGPPPQRTTDTRVEVSDDNRGPSESKQYFYDINIETVDGNGTVTRFNYDPQIINPGG